MAEFADDTELVRPAKREAASSLLQNGLGCWLHWAQAELIQPNIVIHLGTRHRLSATNTSQGAVSWGVVTVRPMGVWL